MFLLKQFLVLIFCIAIYLFIPTSAFGSCQYGFSDIYEKLSPETQRNLTEAGINSMDALTAETVTELRQSGFGENSLNEIRAVLLEKNLSLAEDFTRLEFLGLSSWLRGKLHRAGIKTVEELVEKTEGDLKKLGFGEQALSIIKAALSGRGLSFIVDFTKIESLGLTPRLTGILHGASIYEVSELTSKTEWDLLRLPRFFKATDMRQIRNSLLKRGMWFHFNPEDSSKIESLGLSMEVRQILYKAGFRTVRILTRKTDEDLMDLSGFTTFHLNEVKAALSKRGLFLAAPPKPFNFNPLF